MNLNQLKYFVTLAETLSYTEAAKCLFITQPALSRQINALEEELGTPLFLRTRRNVKLTPGGGVFYRHCVELLDSYQKAVQDAKTANEGFVGSLRIGFLDVYDIMEGFPGVLREFQEKYEDIDLSMQRFSMGELPQMLYDGKLDLILTYGFALFDKPNLVTVDIQRFQSCLMMHKNHPKANQESISLAEFRGETFYQLRPSVSEEGHRYLSSLFEKYNVHPKLKMVDQMEDIMLWIQTGNGVSITTDRTIEKNYPDVVLRVAEMEGTEGHTVAMAWLKSNYNPAIALFMELVERIVKE